jgi:hypothetical protein
MGYRADSPYFSVPSGYVCDLSQLFTVDYCRWQCLSVTVINWSLGWYLFHSTLWSNIPSKWFFVQSVDIL